MSNKELKLQFEVCYLELFIVAIHVSILVGVCHHSPKLIWLWAIALGLWSLNLVLDVITYFIAYCNRNNHRNLEE